MSREHRCKVSTLAMTKGDILWLVEYYEDFKKLRYENPDKANEQLFYFEHAMRSLVTHIDVLATELPTREVSSDQDRSIEQHFKELVNFVTSKYNDTSPPPSLPQ